MESCHPILFPCSSAQAPPSPQDAAGRAEGCDAGERGGSGGDPIAAQPLRRRPLLSKGKGVRFSTSKTERVPKDTDSSSSSSSPSSSFRQPLQRGVRLRSRWRGPWASHRRRRGDGEDCHDLALPLGMSFAAVVAQILDRKNVSGERIPICTSAVKESITNIYGDKFECFTRNFEKSFSSTLKTLWLINETSTIEQGNTICSSFISNSCDSAPTLGTYEAPSTMEEFQGKPSLNSMNHALLHGKINQQVDHVSNGVTGPRFNQSILDTFGRSMVEQTCSNDLKVSTMEEFQENPSSNSMNQLVLHGQRNQEVALVSNGVANPGFNQSILDTFERSVVEQTRSNNLKEVELNLIMKRLQMKQSQLVLTSHANLLEKIKISMGISKASFEEEKLRNKMQNMKHVELLKRCIDLLVTGLIIMSGFLLYGASIYSYQRITEATSTCTSTFKESRSWWIPKPVASFSSGWLMLRCHLVALTRMLFGILMILSVAYLVFQRSAMAGSTMPVTFILLLLGVVCGFAGKFCVDTLGGNGYCWLLYWEGLCLLHFFANVFPSALYRILYGPVSVSRGAKVVRLPYWIRRYTFYGNLLLVLPTLCGLLPFASIHEWKDHFSEKITLWSLGNKYQV
uniref:Protein CPR-5 isoform X2 n=1 Tax=Elaeis guineensis var. tenera TaxID=51953 RepID=A0A6J0PN56_ELAGV|nr:protein CPR-5 isoform X2 [Elaeis guineensis]